MEISMKKFTILLLGISLSLFYSSCFSTKSVQELKAMAEKVDSLVENKNFDFQASYAHPMGFPSIYLSPYYNVKVSPDSVQVYLPYYGRVYAAPMDRSEGGIKFVSTDFEYIVSFSKRSKGQLITIKPHDVRPETTLLFQIWNNGSASLQVNDVNRQPISFQGTLKGF